MILKVSSSQPTLWFHGCSFLSCGPGSSVVSSVHLVCFSWLQQRLIIIKAVYKQCLNNFTVPVSDILSRLRGKNTCFNEDLEKIAAGFRWCLCFNRQPLGENQIKALHFLSLTAFVYYNILSSASEQQELSTPSPHAAWLMEKLLLGG